MARKVGQIVRRGSSTWLVRVYTGRDSETKRRTYLNQTIHGGLRDAQAHLNKMLGERDRGRKLNTGREVTWDDLVKSNEHWDAKIDIEKL